MANTYNAVVIVSSGDSFPISGNAAIKAIADYKAHNYITANAGDGGDDALIPFHAVSQMLVAVSSEDGEEIVDAFCVQDSGSDEGGSDEGGDDEGGDDEGGGGDDPKADGGK